MKKLSFVLFLVTLVFAPLAFGTTEQWSLLTVELLVAFTVFFFCLNLKNPSQNLLYVPGLLPLLLLIGLMVVQILPLPISIVKVFSPETYKVYQPVYEILGGSLWMPLSVYQKGTVHECVRIMTYGFFYILTIQLLSQGERLKKTVVICAWLAIGIAVIAILQKYSSPDKLYWFRSLPTNSSPMGPWVNRSQYCGYVGLVSPLVLALAFFFRPSLSSKESMRQRIVSFFSMPGGNYYILLGFGALILLTSTFISLCRGGIIAISTSFVFFFSLLAWKNARYSRLFFICVIGCMIVSVAWFGWDPILQRFDQITDGYGAINDIRLPLWENSLQLIKDFWLVGSGFGTFVAIFPYYRTLPGEGLFEHAHNDYLELLTDGGVIGFILAAWFVLAVIGHGWKMMNRRRDRYARLVSIGALTGILAMLIHSMTDFNMHNGADGLYFFFLCGLLVAASNTRFYYQMDATLLKPIPWLSRNTFMFAGGIFLCVIILGQGAPIIARLKYEGVKSIYLSRQLSEKILQKISFSLDQASRLDPFEGIYSSMQGDVQRYLQQPGQALGFYLQAGRKDPLDGAFLQQIGMMLPKDQQQKAELLIEKGAQTTLNKDELMLSRAEWLLGTNQRAKAVEVLREGLEQNPKLITDVISFLQSFAFTREEFTALMPKSVEAWLRAGTFLEQIGSIDDGVYFREHALDWLEHVEKIEAWWFKHLYNFYRKQQEDEKALEVLRLGIEKIPGNVQFHIWLGDHYTKQKITYRAKEEYQQALLLEPGNASVRSKIEKLVESFKE